MSAESLQALIETLREAQPPRREPPDLGWAPPRVTGTLQERWDRVPRYAMTDDERAALDAQRDARERERQAGDRRESLRRFLARRGSLYATCTLENYETLCSEQGKVLQAVRDYASRLPDELAAGRGLLLFGEIGTGKDHLLVGLARLAILKHGLRVVWWDGMTFYRALRDHIADHTPEGLILDPIIDAEIAILSDPLPPDGTLSEYERERLFEVVERRRSHRRPLWITMNVRSGKEADERMGLAIFDRLKSGALALFFDWPSYRRAVLPEELTT